MRSFLVLCRKLALEHKWFWGVSALLLFGFGWLFVWVTARIETSIMERVAEVEKRQAEEAKEGEAEGQAQGDESPQRPRGRRGPFDRDTASIEIQLRFWQVAPIVLPVIVWGIARGTGAIAGEVEKGALDIVLSRPISRFSYMSSHVTVGLLGLLGLGGAIVAGNAVGMTLNQLRSEPSPLLLVRPALNLAALGWAMFGISLMLSAFDVVRWRPNLIASCYAVASVVAQVVAQLPSLEEYRETIEATSIFHKYQPLEAATKGAEVWGFNIGILTAVGLACVLVAYIRFGRRDLPANA